MRIRFRSSVLLLPLALLWGCPDDDEPSRDSGVHPDAAVGDAGTRDSGDVTVGCENNPPIDPPTSGTCNYTAGTGDATLLRGAVILPDSLLINAHVLVNAAGKVVCAACDCSGEAGFATATVIACKDGVITPGLINTHDHIGYTETPPTPPTDPEERYDHRHEWRIGQNGKEEIPSVRNSGGNNGVSWGELRQVMAGSTTLNGSGGAEGLMRNIDQSSDRQEGLNLPRVAYETFPLDDARGTKKSGNCEYGDLDRPDNPTIRDAPAYTPHIAEGIDEFARNEFLCLSSSENGGQDVMMAKTAVIHGIGLLAEDYALMAQEGSSLIWSVRTNISLYGHTSPVVMAAHLGVQIALGTDWTASGSMNMVRELRCADEYNQRNLNSFFTDRDLFDMATLNAASVLGASSKIGALLPGYEADIAIWNGTTNTGLRAVINSDPEDVVLVMRGGLPLYGDASLMESLGQTNGCEQLDVCQVSKRACVERETGSNIATLRSAIMNGAYELFHCGLPPLEPSCVPFRSMEFMGVGSADDNDGDGVINSADSCPNIFNPVRPMDNGEQADGDQDNVGDACDPCPLQAGTTGCSPPNPRDRDGDGVEDHEDNCPTLSNALQEDRDNDDKGDVCDECPDFSNPGNAGCPATIYQVKQDQVSGPVSISNVLVTAVGGNGYFVQTIPGDAEFDPTLQEDFSGLFIYTGSDGAKPALGDRIDLNGTVDEYQGQTQLANSTFTVTASNQTMPDPIVVSPSDVATSGSRVAELEGVLLEVRNVIITDINPDDPENYNEFVVDGSLRVNDFLYLLDPFPQLNEQAAYIRGILHWANDNSKLEPRSADDVAFPPQLLGFEPAEKFIVAGSTGVPAGGFSIWLNRPAQSDVVVDLSSTSSAAMVARSVTVSTGTTSAEVAVDTSTVVPPGPVTITATYNGASVDATIYLYDDNQQRNLDEVELNPTSLPRNGSGAGYVSIDLPGAIGGSPIGLSVVPSYMASVPAQVVIPEGLFDATFTVTASTSTGAAVLTFDDGVNTATVAFNVTSCAVESVFINEIHYDNNAGDTGEEIEVAGPAGLDLSGWTIELYNGNGGTSYNTIALSGVIPNQGGGAGVVAIGALPANGIQNGAPDGVALVDNTGTLIQFLSYEGSFTASAGPASGMGSIDIGVSESSATPAGFSLQLSGQGDSYDDFTWQPEAAATFGAVNAGQVFCP